MRRLTDRYETEVHIGLLVIILIMLSLNVASNYVIYSVRDSQANQVAAQLQQAVIGIDRAMEGRLAVEMPDYDIELLRQQFSLSSICFVPARPPDDDREAKRVWLAAIARRLPPSQFPDFARKLFTSNYESLTRGENDEYFLVHPVNGAKDKFLMVLGVQSARLAHLDDSRTTLLWISVAAILSLTLVYLVVSRRIFQPMRRLRKEAKKAGRDVIGDDESALIEDYRTIIDELREKERELLIANEEISLRADSLEQYNRYLLQSMTSGLVTIDQDGRVQSINSAATDLLDLQPLTQAGRHFRELLVCDEALGDSIESLLSDGKPVEYREMSLTTPGGRDVVIGLSCSAVRSDDDDAMGASLLIQDLTELRALQSQLESKNRMAALGELTSGLAHQLRNSMGAMVGYAKLLQKRIERGDAEPGSAAAVLTEAQQAEQLIERFLSFSRPLELQHEDVTLKRLIDEIVDSLRVQPESEHIEFTVDCDPALRIQADSLLLKQSIGNLIQNAVDAYDGAVGVVLVKVVEENSAVLIHVVDHAGGIPEDRRDSIFTPFFSSRPSGTGLGLPLAARLVDLHNGSLTVRSAVGEGSTFTINLPQSSPVSVR